MSTAVGGSNAWRRHITIDTTPASGAMTQATISPVFVTGGAMTVAILLRTTGGWNATLCTTPPVRTAAITAISLIQVPCKAMTIAIVCSDTRWRNSAIVSSVIVCAVAHAAISRVNVIGAAMTVAQLLDSDRNGICCTLILAFDKNLPLACRYR